MAKKAKDFIALGKGAVVVVHCRNGESAVFEGVAIAISRSDGEIRAMFNLKAEPVFRTKGKKR